MKRSHKVASVLGLLSIAAVSGCTLEDMFKDVHSQIMYGPAPAFDKASNALDAVTADASETEASAIEISNVESNNIIEE